MQTNRDKPVPKTARRQNDQERFRHLMEFAPIAFLMVDRQGCLRFANRQAEQLFGYASQDLLGRHYTVLVPERLHEVHRQYQADFFSLPQARTLGTGNELLAIHKDGTEFPVEVGLTPLTTDDGVMVLGAVVDVSERKRAAQALLDSELRTRSILQAALDAVVMMDPAGQITFWNPQAEAIFGYSAEEAVGRNLAELIIPASSRFAHAEGLLRYLATGTGPVFNRRLEMTALRRGGEEFPIELTVLPVTMEERHEFSAFVRDITERRRANDRFRLAVESAPNGMVMVDGNGLIVLVNSEAEKLFGFARDELLGQPVEMLVPVRFRAEHPKHRANYFAAPRTRAMGAGRELYGVRRDGSEFPIEIALNPIETEDGLMVLSAIVDITERKRTQEWLQDMNRTLERRVEERTHLVSLLKDVAATCNQAESVQTAILDVLERVCRYLGWPFAHAFLVSELFAGASATTDLWFPEQVIPSAIRQSQACRTQFLADEVITGRVVTTGNAEWIADVTQRSDILRQHEFETLGVRAIFCMPVKLADQVVAVLEFLSDEPFPPNDELLAIADQLGGLLGRVIERDELQRAVAELVEAEQRRIAHELHDGLGQELTALSLLSRSIATTLKAEGSAAADNAEEFARSIPKLVRQIRSVIRGLMPVELDANGLMSALQQLADNTEQRHGITCRLEASQVVPVKDPTVAHHLFRIAQEAINNALKHGRPESIILSLLGSGSELDLRIRDDGVGVSTKQNRDDTQRRGMGMRIMRHRASLIGANLTIRSPRQGGTLVTCRLTEKDSANDGG